MFVSSNQKKKNYLIIVTKCFLNNYGDEKDYKMVFALKKSVLFHYTDLWKISPNMNFGTNWGCWKKSVVASSGTRTYALATLNKHKLENSLLSNSAFNMHYKAEKKFSASVCKSVCLYVYMLTLKWRGLQLQWNRDTREGFWEALKVIFLQIDLDFLK